MRVLADFITGKKVQNLKKLSLEEMFVYGNYLTKELNILELYYGNKLKVVKPTIREGLRALDFGA
jgi:hypothetical protein